MYWMQFEILPNPMLNFGRGESSCCPKDDIALLLWLRQLGMPRILEAAVVLIAVLCTVLLLFWLFDLCTKMLHGEVQWRKLSTYSPLTTFRCYFFRERH